METSWSALGLINHRGKKSWSGRRRVVVACRPLFALPPNCTPIILIRRPSIPSAVKIGWLVAFLQTINDGDSYDSPLGSIKPGQRNRERGVISGG